MDVKECGITKSCYISPDDCDRDTKKCNYILKWRFEDGVVSYELKAVTNGWASVTFSEDRLVVSQLQSLILSQEI
jgi:hypothetical protein